jgi:hypothetical protein
MGTDDETELRAFLQSPGYNAPDNSVPAEFDPQLPVEMMCEISPLPDEAVKLTALATELFRQVCGLSDDFEVTICYHEREK